MADRESPNDAIFAALASGHGRSPVYRWLRSRHAAVGEALGKVGSRPNWQALADLMAADGVRDAKGNPPSGVLVRAKWREVCTDLGFAADFVRPVTQVTDNRVSSSETSASGASRMVGRDPLLDALGDRKMRGGRVL